MTDPLKLQPFITVSSDGGRIGRIGWTNRKTTYTTGKIWWAQFWPEPYPFIIKSAVSAVWGSQIQRAFNDD